MKREPKNLTTSDHVAAHLSRNAWRYQEALRLVERTLHQYAESDEGRQHVYRVYTRADRQQGGEALKDVWQIKEEVNRERDSLPTFAIQDLADIIAATVVCVYGAGVEKVDEFIRSLREFEVLKRDDQSRDHGHRGLHLHIAFTDSRFAGIKCEVQVKTVLADAWDAWTHDLTYKPGGGDVPPLYARQFKTMADHLKLLEATTEDFRQAIEAEWQQERRAKDLARAQLLSIITHHPDCSKRARRYGTYMRLVSRIDRLRPSQARAGKKRELLTSAIARFGRQYGHDCDTARLFTRLAARGQVPILLPMALDSIERWLQRADNPMERERALTFMGMVLFGFECVPQAIAAAERALLAADNALSKVTQHKVRADRRRDVTHRYFLCLGNLAYYLADKPRSPTKSERSLALVKRMQEEARPRRYALTPAQLDTIGFVLMAVGTSEEQVSEGMRMCVRAHQIGTRRKRSKESEATAEAFYKMHMDFGRVRLELFKPSEMNLPK